MSAVTLKTLKADFRRERKVHLDRFRHLIREVAPIFPPFFRWPFKIICYYKMARIYMTKASAWAETEATDTDLYRAAKLYTIACDKGINAAMLWKLSN